MPTCGAARDEQSTIRLTCNRRALVCMGGHEHPFLGARRGGGGVLEIKRRVSSLTGRVVAAWLMSPSSRGSRA
eukprot:10447679-Lingulodinium_polyedra.AAC.1